MLDCILEMHGRKKLYQAACVGQTVAWPYSIACTNNVLLVPAGRDQHDIHKDGSSTIKTMSGYQIVTDFHP